MKCEHVQSLLDIVVDGETDFWIYHRVHLHALRCASCAAALHETEEIRQAMRGWRAVPAPETLRSRLAQIDQREASCAQAVTRLRSTRKGSPVMPSLTPWSIALAGRGPLRSRVGITAGLVLLAGAAIMGGFLLHHSRGPSWPVAPGDSPALDAGPFYGYRWTNGSESYRFVETQRRHTLWQSREVQQATVGDVTLTLDTVRLLDARAFPGAQDPCSLVVKAAAAPAHPGRASAVLSTGVLVSQPEPRSGRMYVLGGEAAQELTAALEPDRVHAVGGAPSSNVAFQVAMEATGENRHGVVRDLNVQLVTAPASARRVITLVESAEGGRSAVGWWGGAGANPRGRWQVTLLDVYPSTNDPRPEPGDQEYGAIARVKVLEAMRSQASGPQEAAPLLGVAAPWKVIAGPLVQPAEGNRQAFLYRLGLDPKAPWSALSGMQISYVPSSALRTLDFHFATIPMEAR